MSNKSEKQKTLQELHEESTKDLEIFEYPEYDNPDFVPETYEEWLEEMEYEESLMTQEEKGEEKKRSKEYLKTLKQILIQHHPEQYIDKKIMCEYCLEPTTSYIVNMTIVTKLKDIDVEYRGKRAFCYQCDQKRYIDEIMQYNKEQCYKKFSETLEKQNPEKIKDINISKIQLKNLLEGFEDYQNHLEYDDIPLVGEEL